MLRARGLCHLPQFYFKTLEHFPLSIYKFLGKTYKKSSQPATDFTFSHLVCCLNSTFAPNLSPGWLLSFLHIRPYTPWLFYISVVNLLASRWTAHYSVVRFPYPVSSRVLDKEHICHTFFYEMNVHYFTPRKAVLRRKKKNAAVIAPIAPSGV